LNIDKPAGRETSQMHCSDSAEAKTLPHLYAHPFLTAGHLQKMA